MFNLYGKTALITGASGGIGGAVARVLHAAGASVLLTGTRADALLSVSKELGERSKIIPANLTEKTSIDALIEEVEAEKDKVDILVNNAGLTRDTLSMRLTDDDWEMVLALNLTAAFKLSRGILRGMMKRRWGRIINITSIVGVTGNPGQANYAASKAGLVGMSKSMAQEVASRGITINCIAPGMIKTAMTDVLPAERKSHILEIIPAGRFGEPSEIAAGTLFLASDEASYITGQTIHINGGMVMI